MKNKIVLFLFLFLFGIDIVFCQQKQEYLVVHFLYGSKPYKKYKKDESKWFGGILGGHAGVEVDSNQILNFVPQGKFHIVAKKQKNSAFVINDRASFYQILGGNYEENKKLMIVIPITPKQKERLLCVSEKYLAKTPYDYAFLGMRCGAATYDILAQIGILKHRPDFKTSMRIFYPKKVRKKLIKLAQKNNWTIIREEGTKKRKWETD